ncbi:MAG: hypothetical protein ACR2G1_06975 [Rubrobacteraceae bacterium]
MNEEQIQEDSAGEEEYAKEQARERSRVAKQEAELLSWTQFMQSERLELELRKEGQLTDILGGPSGELPTQLRDLASEDRRQAEEGLVALMSGGKVSYKHLEDLSQEDRPARTAANRLRTTWLKERQDGWLIHNDDRAQ